MLLSTNALLAQQLDSLTKVSLGSRIEEYFGALAAEPLEVQKAEADFMIELSADSLIRQFTAECIYEHYLSSPVMGAENVAVHVFDRWFAHGPLKMEDDFDFLNARIFAEFNRQSLVGEKAPALVMETDDGSTVELFCGGDAGGKWRILYFYDAGCTKCKLESMLLRNMLMTSDFPVEFYAIYAGDNREAWDAYVAERLNVGESAAKVVHLWDPELDSDFQRKYGVIQAPRLLLVDPEGIIVGRGLDAKALGVMLHGIFDVPELEYGSEESAALFDGIFEGGATVEDVRRIADYIETSTEGNTVMFRQLTGDLLYWLSVKSGEAFKEGADYLIDNKILSRPEVWKTADDSLKVVGLAQFIDGLLEKARPGTLVSGLKVPGERIRKGRATGAASGASASEASVRVRAGEYRLDRLGGKRNIIIFYTEGCANCDAEKAAAWGLAAGDRRARVLLVNVDRILATDPDLAAELFEAFDLSTLPFLLETDRKGLIRRRYHTLLP